MKNGKNLSGLKGATTSIRNMSVNKEIAVDPITVLWEAGKTYTLVTQEGRAVDDPSAFFPREVMQFYHDASWQAQLSAGPTERMFQWLYQARQGEADHVKQAPNYALLSFFANSLMGGKICEIGTLRGSGTITLAQNPANEVRSYDVHYTEGTPDKLWGNIPSNISFSLLSPFDMRENNFIFDSTLVYIDADHLGVYEMKLFYELFYSSLGLMKWRPKFDGVVIFDDVQLAGYPGMPLMFSEVSTAFAEIFGSDEQHDRKRFAVLEDREPSPLAIPGGEAHVAPIIGHTMGIVDLRDMPNLGK